MASIFTKIVKGEIPCHKIAEDAHYFAFLDINPASKGHTLVIPKQETDYIFDLEDEVLAGLHVFAKKVAKAIEQVVPCERVSVAVVGLEVPHAHVHLIPIHTMRDFSFSNKIKMSQEALADLAMEIRKHIS